MTMKELELKIRENRTQIYEEHEEYEDNGWDLPLEEQYYDEGYVSALEWVLKLMGTKIYETVKE